MAIIIIQIIYWPEEDPNRGHLRTILGSPKETFSEPLKENSGAK